MKNTRKNKHLLRLLFLSFGVCLLNYMALSSPQTYTFKNHEGSTAKDLHIEFSKDVTHNTATQQNPAGTFPDKSPPVGADPHLGLGGGTGVAHNHSVTITVSFEGDTPPDVTKWWWTKNGDENDVTFDNMIGHEKWPATGETSFAIAPATGDGSIKITDFEGNFNSFEMPAGVSGHDMAQLFAQFITDEVPWAEVSHIAAGDVIIFPTTFAGDNDFTVEIVPDSTQEVTFKYLPEVIPTLSEWGVIILLLLVLAVGMAFLYKRKNSLALAGTGEAEVSNVRSSLFNLKLFFKAFGIVLLIGVIGLAASFWYFGQINIADPFGVFISAAVVAYMVQLWLLKKEGRG
jgi:hypothetical protein